MVMFLSGYFNYTFLSPQDTYLSDAATIVGGNQISVEHRFYGNSVPHPTLWKYLTSGSKPPTSTTSCRYSRSFTSAHWLVTGVSKGGETAIFHDYYYPA